MSADTLSASEAPAYLVERWKAEIEGLIHECDRTDVLDWLIANHDRKRVVFVGSGFSRNAEKIGSTGIPLWEDISRALAADLRVDFRRFDALALADFHRKKIGSSSIQSRLLNLLDDSALVPGPAHRALWDSQPEAVITTNVSASRGRVAPG